MTDSDLMLEKLAAKKQSEIDWINRVVDRTARVCERRRIRKKLDLAKGKKSRAIKRVDNQAYWLIEKSIGGRPHWWMCYDGANGDSVDADSRWTVDSGKASRYTSKAIAEYIMGIELAHCVATEHIDG